MTAREWVRVVGVSVLVAAFAVLYQLYVGGSFG